MQKDPPTAQQALVGSAISVLPAESARPYADAFGLCVVPLADDWARSRFAISTRDESTLSTAASLLVEHLVASGQAADTKTE